MAFATRDGADFRALMDRAPLALLVHQEGKIIYANEAMAKILGCERALDLVGCEVPELIVRRAISGMEQTSEVIVMGDAPAEAIFLRDVGAESRALAKLHRSEENLHTIMERSPFAMCICRSDRMIYVNPAMIEYLGYDSKNLLGPTLAELSDEVIHPDDRPRVREAFRVLFAELAGTDFKPVEAVKIADIRVRRKIDGLIRVCDMHGVIVMHDGSPALVNYLEDLTERRSAEARMRLADRMSSLGTLAAGIAHEINNPLAYVMANVDLVGQSFTRGRSKQIDLGRSIEDAQTGLGRIRRIVQGLKTFSRGDEETIGPVDIIPVLESCIEMAQTQLRHRCTVARDYVSYGSIVRGNEARLGQVFLNLLVNAAQALDEQARERNVVEVTVTIVGDRVRVSVADNGAGISPENLPRIFDPFFTTKPVGTGTGLGLSVCHGIVTALGGEITVESTLGQGTRVSVELSVAQGPTTLRPKELNKKGRRARVLVVDDEVLLLDVMGRALGSDHDVITATDGREALERIAEQPAFDFIFCDLMMPGMSGMDLFASLTRSHPDLARRIVFLTGGAVTTKAARLLEEAPNRVIEKPFDPQQIRNFIQERM